MVSDKKTDKTNWNAVNSVATLLAVVIALFSIPQALWEWWHKPILEISPPSSSENFLRWGHEYGGSTGFISVEIQLQNTGRSPARRSQPLLTAMGEEKNGKWYKEPHWVPVNLDWILDEYERKAHGKPTGEKDLIPHVPYIFVLGRVIATHPTNFTLAHTLVPTGVMKTSYPPGKYCFEITAFGEQIEPVRQYFHVYWQGGYNTDPKDMKIWLNVFARHKPPW